MKDFPRRQSTVVKAVVFDLGGVLIELYAAEARRELIEKYGIQSQSFNRLTRSSFASHRKSITELAMVGRIGISAYLEAFSRACTVKDEQGIRVNRLSVVGPERANVFNLAKQLKQAGFVCCVLTNTIALHWEKLNSKRTYPSLGTFDHIFASHLIACAKPEEAAFSFVTNALNIPASECLLVDDTPLNVDRARAVGWHSILFSNIANLQHDLHDLTNVKFTDETNAEL